jgi:hypothetical protein
LELAKYCALMPQKRRSIVIILDLIPRYSSTGVIKVVSKESFMTSNSMDCSVMISKDYAFGFVVYSNLQQCCH